MSVIEKLHRARKLPAQEILRRVRGRIAERWAVARERRRDRRQSSYGRICESGNVALCTHLRAPAPTVYSFRTGAIAENVALVLTHHFDVLGSGWVSADYGAVARGFAGHRYGTGEAPHTNASGEWLSGRINAANLADSIRCWRLVSAGYRAIDWQRDLRSGYRWSEGLPSVDLGLDDFPPPGADVKVPWELARMQHLPILAWAFGLARSGAPGFEDAARYQVEFCDQVSDFCALNPPRFGVNWACSMDVAIRVVSWLATFDVFRGFGAQFSGAWSAMFARAIQDHAAHLVGNLERVGSVRANHYLANVAGLAFAAAALPRDAAVDAWLWFAAHEFVREVGLQFHVDGSNFEASTSYHRLSSEMVLWTTGLLLGLADDHRRLLSQSPSREMLQHMPAPSPGGAPWEATPAPLPLNDSYWKRVEGMGRFVRDCSAPDGRIPLIGDEDGGRFLKLVPRWRPSEKPSAADEARGARWTEETRDHRHIRELAESLCGGGEAQRDEAAWEAETLPARRLRPTAGSSRDDLEVREEAAAYPGAGVFLLRRGQHFVSFRCGPVGQDGNGGHAHNDQLAVTADLDGRPVLVDPGTYVYTALPEERNRFRSTEMHNTLQVEELQQCPWSRSRAGLFELHDRARARIETIAPYRLVGSHEGFGLRHRREVRLEEDGLHVCEELEAPRAFRLWFHLDPGVRLQGLPGTTSLRLRTNGGERCIVLRVAAGTLRVQEGAVSPGYGRLEAALVVCLSAFGSELTWSLSVDAAQ